MTYRKHLPALAAFSILCAAGFSAQAQVYQGDDAPVVTAPAPADGQSMAAPQPDAAAPAQPAADTSAVVNVPASPGDASTQTPGQQAAAVVPRKPLLIIRFNKHYVYFDRALQQAVNSAERIKPNVIYDVVSYAPLTGSRMQNTHRAEDAGADLQSVIQEMQSMGVAPDRIRTSTPASADISSPEIQIFVN